MPDTIFHCSQEEDDHVSFNTHDNNNNHNQQETPRHSSSTPNNNNANNAIINTPRIERSCSSLARAFQLPHPKSASSCASTPRNTSASPESTTTAQNKTSTSSRYFIHNPYNMKCGKLFGGLKINKQEQHNQETHLVNKNINLIKENDLVENTPRDHRVPSASPSSMSEDNFTKQQIFTSLQHLCCEANKHNLHAAAMSTSPTLSGIVTVPYCLANDPEFDINVRCKLGSELAASLVGKTTVLFIGHLPLVIPSTKIVALLIKSLTGITPIRISMTRAGRTAQGRVTSPLAIVEVYNEEAPILIANLHRRVLFDQTAFHVATKTEDILPLNQYCKMLEVNHKTRFNHRPFSVLTISRSTNPGEARRAHDEINPLCSCHTCRNFIANHTNFSYLQNTYLPHVASSFEQQQCGSSCYDTTKLLETHAFLNKESLNPEEQKLYTPVYVNALGRCGRGAAVLWESLHQQNETGLQQLDASFTSKEVSCYRGNNNGNNNRNVVAVPKTVLRF